MNTQATKNVSSPKYRISEERQSLIIRVALPGVSKEAIQVSSEDQILQIRADRELSIQQDWNLISNYNAPDCYNLELNISKQYEVSNAEAEFKNNVLELTFPEKESKLIKLTIN